MILPTITQKINNSTLLPHNFSIHAFSQADVFAITKDYQSNRQIANKHSRENRKISSCRNHLIKRSKGKNCRKYLLFHFPFLRSILSLTSNALSHLAPCYTSAKRADERENESEKKEKKKLFFQKSYLYSFFCAFYSSYLAATFWIYPQPHLHMLMMRKVISYVCMN